MLAVSDLLRRHAVDAGHGHGPGLRLWQPGPRAAPFRGVVVGFGDPFRCVGHRGEDSGKIVRVDGRRGPHTDDVDGEVMGDGPQPGTDGAAARVKHLGVPPRLLEGLLGDILRRRGVADYGHRYAEDQPLEAAHERERQLRIAGAQAGEQRLVW